MDVVDGYAKLARAIAESYAPAEVIADRFFRAFAEVSSGSGEVSSDE